MTTERIEPPLSGDERESLETWLDYHRATLALKCEGLTAEQLRERAIPTTALTLLGLVRHMAEVERGWFRRMLVGEDVERIYSTAEDRERQFTDLTSHAPEEVFQIWQAEIEQAREISKAHSLDDSSKRVDVRNEPFSLRWILTHMIEEYARHNGHADLIREAIDRSTGD